MPNGRTLTLPSGRLPVGLLRDSVKEAGVTVEEFIDEL
jgi:hypothetical protein